MSKEVRIIYTDGKFDVFRQGPTYDAVVSGLDRAKETKKFYRFTEPQTGDYYAINPDNVVAVRYF